MKGKILKVLRSGNCISGELLSKELGVSRVSIWKNIRSLKEDGYIIEASHKGYRLISSPDLLLPYEFPERAKRMYHSRELGSTMSVAKEWAKKGAEEGTIVVAESQTQGKGRLGREWLSPRGGIYFTIILRPKISPLFAPRINLMASVAVAKAIRKKFGLKAELKWPNDVLIKGRKVCGILSEMEAEMDAVNYVNVGVGINVNSTVSQPKRTATSIRDELGREVPRREFLTCVLEEIDKGQELLTSDALLEEWKKLSVTLNREVKIMSLGEELRGRAIDIDTSGALILKGKDGSLRKIIAGDCIHLR